VYWQESPSEVRRCSWFYKRSSDTHSVPYEESVSTRLEEEFKIAATTNVWHRRVEFPNGETVVFHGPNSMFHHQQAASPDAWGNTPVSVYYHFGIDNLNACGMRAISWVGNQLEPLCFFLYVSFLII